MQHFTNILCVVTSHENSGPALARANACAPRSSP